MSKDTKMWSSEQFNICEKLGREIDYTLVKMIRPACIEQMNGCGNCKECKTLVVETYV